MPINLVGKIGESSWEEYPKEPTLKDILAENANLRSELACISSKYVELEALVMKHDRILKQLASNA